MNYYFKDLRSQTAQQITEYKRQYIYSQDYKVRRQFLVGSSILSGIIPSLLGNPANGLRSGLGFYFIAGIIICPEIYNSLI
ncbi:hypothetical protein pb186bvf_012191 [Paramecium bursaria]